MAQEQSRKEAQIGIKIPMTLLEEFNCYCRSIGEKRSSVIRGLIRDLINKNSSDLCYREDE